MDTLSSQISLSIKLKTFPREMNNCYCNWNIEENIWTCFHFIFICENKMIATAVTIKNICKLFDFSFYYLSFLFHSKKYFQKILLLKQNTTLKKSTLHIFNTTDTTDCYHFYDPVKLKVITLIHICCGNELPLLSFTFYGNNTVTKIIP